MYSDTGHWPGEGYKIPALQYVIIALDPDISTAWPWGVAPSDLLENNSNWPGWDGPYMERLYGMHPWAGTYLLFKMDLSWVGAPELWLMFWDACYANTDWAHRDCFIPENSAIKMDSDIDDGNFNSGLFRVWVYASGNNNYLWMLAQDIRW